MEKETVSIIIPVYKGEHTVARCVHSLENGIYKNIEIILINDCSPDESNKVLSELKQQYDNVIVLQNDRNKGVSYTRNQGLAIMSGKYLMFVDCDDWVVPEYVFEFVEGIKNSDVDFGISGYINHDEVHNNRTDFFGYDQKENIRKYCLSTELPRLYNMRLLQQLWNKIFLTDIIRDKHIRFDESINMGEDFRFVLQYLQAAQVKDFIFINKGLYQYIRDNGGSLMSTFGNEKIEEPLKNVRMMLPLMEIDEQKKQVYYEKEKTVTINQYAYRIIHARNLSFVQKILKIKELPEKKWMHLLLKHYYLLVKEKAASILGRIKR